MTQIYLIRHAVNDWVAKKLAGWTPGVRLSEEGQKQAVGLAKRLEPIPLVAIYASPLERTMETAEAIAAERGLTVQMRDGLGEVRYGDWTAKTFNELTKTELWKKVQVYPSGARFPAGESLREMQSRAVAAIETIAEAHPKKAVAIVSHADVIKSIVAHFAGVPLDLFQRIVIDPASITVLQLSELRPMLVRMNDTGSLEPMETQEEKDDEHGEPPTEDSSAVQEDDAKPE